MNELKQSAGVPIRLPSFLPFDNDPANPLYANIRWSGQAGYLIEIGWSPDCEGGNWCHYGTVQGSKGPIADDGKRSPVKLGHNIEGYFVNFTCGLHCDDAMIGWSEHGYHYDGEFEGLATPAS